MDHNELVQHWRYLGPSADAWFGAWLGARDLPAPPPPLRRSGPDDSPGCAAIYEFATLAGAPPRETPEWGVDDGSADAPERAAASGQLGLLERMWGAPPRAAARRWGCEVCRAAAGRGDIEMLRWLRERGCPWDVSACAAAVDYGHPETLRWLRAQTPPCPWSWTVCAGAARNGDLETLRWILEQDPLLFRNDRICSAAAAWSHFDVLRWLRGLDPPCPWDRAECRRLAAEVPGVPEWIDAQNEE